MPETLPNLHHLELFYHVASSGGITAATRAMPYGIQQPAVSGQVAQLEKDLGVRLFQRRPFKLTPAGKELHDYLAPFFSALPEVCSRISGKASRRLRLAAPVTLIRDHLPAVLSSVRKVQPDLELFLTDADQGSAFEMLEREEVDLAVTELVERPPSGVRHETLISMPLVLLLPPGFTSPKSGVSGIAAALPLVRPPDFAAVSRLFSKGLDKAGIRWPASIEVNSLELVHTYVAKGFGAGLSIAAPGIRIARGVTSLELGNFPKLAIAALWRGKLNPLAELVLSGLRERAKG
ncbi:LysR family transcriptional regulator [Luteolibacter ambystomatis]|uniref:LysR family transcriptional regulator n=1 Tax=Luteolibacter ambystomatis TaxID=2824561 RepID=A0A975IZ85_9BACT|nr:LysR family transcriptional regulator [Luteolibacter ambystomatis]QUE50653.1 LysR family transcriptional regulator [Luteolibacter ambystomatis]